MANWNKISIFFLTPAVGVREVVGSACVRGRGGEGGRNAQVYLVAFKDVSVEAAQVAHGHRATTRDVLDGELLALHPP